MTATDDTSWSDPAIPLLQCSDLAELELFEHHIHCFTKKTIYGLTLYSGTKVFRYNIEHNLLIMIHTSQREDKGAS